MTFAHVAEDSGNQKAFSMFLMRNALMWGFVAIKLVQVPVYCQTDISYDPFSVDNFNFGHGDVHTLARYTMEFSVVMERCSPGTLCFTVCALTVHTTS